MKYENLLIFLGSRITNIIYSTEQVQMYRYNVFNYEE